MNPNADDAPQAIMEKLLEIARMAPAGIAKMEKPKVGTLKMLSGGSVA